MKTLISVSLIFFIALNFIFTGCGEKKDETTQTKKEDKTTKQTQQQTPPQTQSNTEAPKIGMIWNQIEKKTEALGQVIQNKKAPHLDEPIAEVLNLLKTLPGKSLGLATTKLDVVNSKIKEIETIGNTMDQFQHNKKETEVKKEFEKFTKALGEIKSQYPAESFN